MITARWFLARTIGNVIFVIALVTGTIAIWLQVPESGSYKNKYLVVFRMAMALLIERVFLLTGTTTNAFGITRDDMLWNTMIAFGVIAQIVIIKSIYDFLREFAHGEEPNDESNQDVRSLDEQPEKSNATTNST